MAASCEDPRRLAQELGSAVAADWHCLRCSVSRAFLEHQRHQEEVIAAYIERMSAQGGAVDDVTPDRAPMPLDGHLHRGLQGSRRAAAELAQSVIGAGSGGATSFRAAPPACLVGSPSLIVPRAGLPCGASGASAVAVLPPANSHVCSSDDGDLKLVFAPMLSASIGDCVVSSDDSGSRTPLEGASHADTTVSHADTTNDSEKTTSHVPSARRKSVDLERFRLTSLNLAQPDDTLSWRRRAQDRMAAYLSRLRDKKEPPRHGYCSRWIGHWLFEVLSAAVIISDCAMTVYNADYQMEHLRPVNGAFVFAFEWFLVAYYSLELAMKLTVHRLYFFAGDDAMWNWLDFTLVVLNLVDAVAWTLLSEGGADMTFMRAIRILRLSRILRGLRLMRFFAELRVMLNSLLGSVVSLFWSLVMLALIYYLFGLIFVQSSVDYLTSEGANAPGDLRDELRRLFGSVSVAMLSLFKASFGGDDWGAYYDVAAATGAGGAFMFAVFIAFTYIALMNILTGIFVDNAMQYAQPDRDALALEQRKQQAADAISLRGLFRELTGESGSDTLSFEVFSSVLRRSSRLRAHLSMLGLDIRDAEMFFTMLSAASDTDEVDIDTFVDGCMRLKGPASSIDLQSLALNVKLVQKHIRRLRDGSDAKFAKLSRALGIEDSEETA